MPWVVREAVRDINRAVGRRWHAIDPLLPDPATLPAGCGEPLVVTADSGRIAGLGVCVHQHISPDSLNQTWGAADRFTLVPRLAGPDVAAPADQLLAQWRDHLAGIGATRGPDTSAGVVWPSLDVTGVRALLRHGLQPLTVIAARTRPSRRRAVERPAARRPRRHHPRGRPGRRGAGARPGTTTDPLRHAVRRAGLAGEHRPAGQGRDPRQPGPPDVQDVAGRAERPRGRPAGRAVAAGGRLDRRDDERGRGGVPADDVRRSGRARHRDRRRPGQAPARRGSTAPASTSRCCTTARSTRCRPRSGTGWATGRCGPAGRPAPPARCGDRGGPARPQTWT